MKKLCILLILIFWGIFQAYSTENNPRITYSINDSWQFRLGTSDIGEDGWSMVSIPHTWNAEDCVDDFPGFYRGTGWYRKNIQVDSVMLSRSLYLFFEGANQRTKLFVNRHRVGEHIGGYTFFCFNITPYIREGENQLVVCVDNSYDPEIPPLSADFTFFGGIYRDVSLISVSPIHISTTHYASSGVYVNTPEITEEKALVDICTMLSNTQAERSKIFVEHKIYSATGECVATSKKKVIVDTEREQAFNIQIVVNHPELWEIERPNLYRLQTCLWDNEGKLLDEVSNTFGIRTCSFSAEKGFELNGKAVKLLGTNRHQCHLGMGNALKDEMHVRDIELLHAMGGNFLRIAHYPQDEMVLAACNRLGIVTSVEIPVINTITMSQKFSDNCVEMMKEMIYQCFNSPSVCIWAYMNEIMLRPLYNSESSIKKDEYLKHLYHIAERIENTAKEVDPGRATMLPCHGNLAAYEEANLINLSDILGMNLYNGWYGGEFSGFEAILDTIHQKYPDKPIIISEYGADVDARIHSFKPERFDFSVDYGVMYHRHYLPQIIQRKFVVGSAVWNLNDFHSEERMDAIPHVNCKGLVTLDRIPKDTYRYYKAMLSKEPYVAIGGSDWYNRSGVADNSGVCYYPVSVYTNLKQVNLKVNGKMLAVMKAENGIAQFNVPFINGINQLEAEGVSQGSYVKDFCRVNMKLVPDSFDNKESFTELNMLFGTARHFEDKTASLAWQPEREYTSGGWGYVGGKAFRARTKRGSQPASNLNIYGTEQDPIFQTQRRGLNSFKADLPDGRYVVYLYWTELSGADVVDLAYQLDNIVQKEKATERLFHVDINGMRVLSSLDVAKEVGVRRPMICKIPVTISAKKGLAVDFIPIKGETMITAIRILKMD